MLMVCILPLIKSVRQPKKRAMRRILDWLCVIAALAAIAQLLLQLTGAADLRQSLALTHCLLILSSLLLVANSAANHLRESRGGSRRQVNCIWFLGVGVLLDLMIYYFGGVFDGLPVTLFTMFLYVLSEGILLCADYARQQRMLEEKEAQLTMSRVTLMMSQIRSHFVFNILNAISGMCKYDPEKADETVVRFARYLSLIHI